MFRFIDVAKESDLDKSIDNYIDTQNASDLIKDLNLGKVAGKAGLLAWDKIKERRILNRFKGVVNLWALVDNAPAIDFQIKNIERIFNARIEREKINSAKKYLLAVEKASAKILPQQKTI